MKALKFIVAICCLSMLVASCKSNMDLTKRHYTKGYYFHKSKSLEQPKVQEGIAASTEKNTPSEMELKKVGLPQHETPELKENAKTNETFIGFTSAEPIKSETKSTFNEQVQKEYQAKSSSSIQQKNKKSSAKGGKGDANLVLMIILCLFPFICLIPVWIHDGRSATLNFWITLLLHLTLIGYIIFSILVVLDVVSLA